MGVLAQLSSKTNFTIAEGDANTAPIAYQTLTGNISSTTNAYALAAASFTTAEKNAIKQGDTFLASQSSNFQLLVVASYDIDSNTIILQNANTLTFSALPALWSEGPWQPGYPREFSIKGTLYKIDNGITVSAVVAYPYNKMKKKVTLIEALSGEVTVIDGIQSADSGSGSGGSGALIDVFEPVTVTPGAAGVGRLIDPRMASKAQPPYFFEITADGVNINLYSATAGDNGLQYNADATLGRWDAINSFEVLNGVTYLVKIWLLS